MHIVSNILFALHLRRARDISNAKGKKGHFAFKTRILEELVKNDTVKFPSSKSAFIISLGEQDPRNSRQERYEQQISEDDQMGSGRG